MRVAVTRNVGWLTVFGFSTENWVRPRGEVRHILGLHRKLFGRVDELNELNVRIQWMGRPFDSPARGRRSTCSGRSARPSPTPPRNTGMVLTVAFDYGSRAELVHAAEQARAAGDTISEASDRAAPVPAGAAAGRRARAHVRRAAHLELHAVADRRRPGVLHRAHLARVRRAELDAALALRGLDEPAAWPRPTTSGTLLAARHRRAAGRRGPARAAGRWPRRSTRGARARSATSSCRRAPAPARRWATSCRRRAARGKTTVVVATATKALQDQLATKDLPFLERAPRPAVRLGRAEGAQQLHLPAAAARAARRRPGPARDRGASPRRPRSRSSGWPRGPARTTTGDLAELDWSPSDTAQRAVTVGSDECPGATRCPMGEPCFAERARQRAAGRRRRRGQPAPVRAHVASGGVLLPEHDVVVVDEAHQLEDIMSDTVGVQIGPGRFTDLAGSAAAGHRRSEADRRRGRVGARRCARCSRPYVGQRLPTPFPVALQDVLIDARGRIECRPQSALRADRHATRGRQAAQAARASSWRRGCRSTSTLSIGNARRLRRVRVRRARAPAARDRSARRRPGAATTASGRSAPQCSPARRSPRRSPRARRHRRRARSTQLDVGSPFDYEHHALLYCAVHLPDPRSPQARRSRPRRDRRADRRGRRAARWRCSRAGRRWTPRPPQCAGTVDVPILTQRDLPKTALVSAFSDDESTCLFATAGFFQGVDIPGRTLSLVIIDRIPFPRPDDPLLSARRELLGASSVRRDRPPARGDAARPGHGPADPQRDRPRRRRRARPAPRHGQLPLGHRRGAAADAAHPPPRRGRGVPARDHAPRQSTGKVAAMGDLPVRCRGRRAGSPPSRSTRPATATRCRSALVAGAAHCARPAEQPDARVIVLTHTRHRSSAPAPT